MQSGSVTVSGLDIPACDGDFITTLFMV